MSRLSLEIPYTLQILCKYRRLFAVDLGIPKFYHVQSRRFSSKNQSEELQD